MMFWVGSGYRQDHLDWNIADSSGSPDVMSELIWKDLRMAEVSFASTGELCFIGAYRVNADYAWILHGENRDSDYAGNHKTIEYSRSINKASRGEAFDFKVGIGHTFAICGDYLKITPLAGYAQMEQHLKMYHGNQTVDLIGLGHGRFPGLNSSYNARWESPWIGVDLLFQPGCDLVLYGSFEAHLPYYKGKGHWNLRTDFFDDFVHKANGKGYWVTLGGFYPLFSGLEVGFTGEAALFKASHGTDTTRFLDVIVDDQGTIIGEQVVTGKTRLNSVHWRSYRFQAFLAYVF